MKMLHLPPSPQTRFKSTVFKFLLTLCVATTFFLLTASYAPQPSLSNKETKQKIDEILKHHPSHHKLSTELLSKSFLAYLDLIDPSKTYLTKGEVDKWLNPSESQLKTTLNKLERGDFSDYMEIREAMRRAIERRNRYEKRLEKAQIIPTSSYSALKNLDWVEENEAENLLYDRISLIRSVQLSSAEKLGDEGKEHFQIRLKKMRDRREGEFLLNGREGVRHNLALSIKAISSALDNHTTYFTPSEAKMFLTQVEQRMFGIGALLRDDFTGMRVIRIIEGSPAAKSNQLKLMDKIIAVDNEPIVGMDIEDAVELIRGKDGTDVTLTLLRESTSGEEKKHDKHDITIRRGEIILKESRFETAFEPFGDGVIAHLSLFSFYEDPTSSSAADLADAIEELKAKYNLKGVLLDLRNNGGGLISQAVNVCSLFIKKGVVVSVKDNKGHVQHLRNTESAPIWDGPLVILTNRSSASASEIVAGTLRDYGRAIVVGDDRTFGKGSYQSFTLETGNHSKVNPKGEYKVTRGRYYTVSGKTPQLTGVKSDINVPGYLSKLDVGEEFSKFPLSNDEIVPQFDDTLSDIPPELRGQVKRMYKFDLQPVLTTYTSHLPHLLENSKVRIENNKQYQTFLEIIAKEDIDSDDLEPFEQSDLQLGEAINITKDLIILTLPTEQPIR